MCQDRPIHQTLPGWQYARGWERSLSTQSKDIVLAPGEPILYCQRQLFCFVAFRLQTADLTGGEVQTGKLACMNEHHYLTARAWAQGKQQTFWSISSTRESVQSVLSVVEEDTYPAAYCPPGSYIISSYIKTTINFSCFWEKTLSKVVNRRLYLSFAIYILQFELLMQ